MRRKGRLRELEMFTHKYTHSLTGTHTHICMRYAGTKGQKGLRIIQKEYTNVKGKEEQKGRDRKWDPAGAKAPTQGLGTVVRDPSHRAEGKQRPGPETSPILWRDQSILSPKT